MELGKILGLVFVFVTLAPASAFALATPQATMNFVITPGDSQTVYMIVQNTENSARSFTLTSDSTWVSFGTDNLNAYTRTIDISSTIYVPVKITVPSSTSLGLYDIHILLDNSSFVSVGVEVTVSYSDALVLRNLSDVTSRFNALESGIGNLSSDLAAAKADLSTGMANVGQGITEDIRSNIDASEARIESGLSGISDYNKQAVTSLQEANQNLASRTSTLESSNTALSQTTGNVVAAETMTFFIGVVVGVVVFYLFVRKPGWYPKHY